MAAIKFTDLAATNFLRACRQAEAYSRDELIRIAVYRGCRHYAGFAEIRLTEDVPDLPHEILGCALLRGPFGLEVFQAIRVGAMVISDAANSPEKIGAAATAFGVEGRVAHIAHLALKVGDQIDFWQAVLASFSLTDNSPEAERLPGISRFRSETHMTGLGRGPALIWLRTAYAR